MPASRCRIALLLIAVAACQPAAPGSTSTPSATTAGAASVAPTRSPAAPRATPRPGPGAVVNDDGSVRVRFAEEIMFAEAVGVDGALWGIVQDTTRHVVRVNPETYEVQRVVSDIPIRPNPHLPIVAGGFIWLVGPDTVTQYDAVTGRKIRDIKVGKSPIEPLVAFGDVWTVNHQGDSVTRIDTATGKTTTIDLPGSGPLTFTVVADDLIVVNGPGPMFYPADPTRMQPVGTPYQPGACFTYRGVLGYGTDGRAWLKPCEKDEIVLVDPRTGTVTETFDSPAFPYPPLVVDGTPWFPNAESNTRGPFRLFALDPITHEVVATYEQPTDILEGWVFTAFDSWWRWGNGGLLRIPADTLRAAAR